MIDSARICDGNHQYDPTVNKGAGIVMFTAFNASSGHSSVAASARFIVHGKRSTIIKGTADSDFS